MECLLRRKQPVLMDDIGLLLFEISMSDFDDFYHVFLPNLVSTMTRSSELKQTVRKAWPDQRDSVSFVSNCQSFLSKYRYAMSISSLVS